MRVAKPKRGASERAIDYCMRLLCRRQYSEGELKEKLIERGYSEHEIAMAINRLNELGLIDDEELSKQLVQSAIERQSYGRHALMARMRRLKLKEDCIQSAIKLLDLEMETQIATKLIRKWLSDGRHEGHEDAIMPSYGAEMERLISRLVRRGFSGEAIMEALRRIGCKPSKLNELCEALPQQGIYGVDECYES